MKRFDGAGRPMRRGIPIHAYVGPNGGGKSLAMVHDTLPTLAGIPWECSVASHDHTRRGITVGLRRVLSTVELLEPAVAGEGTAEGDDGEAVRVHPLYSPLREWRQLFHAEHCDILLDEVTGAASSRGYAALPPQLVQRFVQLRRRDCQLRYTTPNWARTDVVLREVTQAVTVCRGWFAQQVPGLLWPSKRLFRWSTYDSLDWEEMSMEKVAKVKPLHRAWYWRPGRPAMAAYRTLEEVLTMEHVTDSGACIECGGTRARPKCGCDRFEPRALAVTVEMPAAVEEQRALLWANTRGEDPTTS